MAGGMPEHHGVHADIGELMAFRHHAGLLPLNERRTVNHSLTGRQRSRHRGRGLDFDELRHYQVGDDIRQLDWKVTRRMGEPFVRVYTEERHQDLVLVVDQRVSMFFGSASRMKSVTACELAAMLAWRALDAGERVGAVLVNDSRVEEIRPRRSSQRLMSLFHRLCAMNAELHAGIRENASPMKTALRHLRALANHNHNLWIISDLAGLREEDKLLMADLARRNSLSIAFIYDELERSLPENGILGISDGERSVAVDAEAGSRACRREFAGALAEWTGFCRQHGIDLIPFHGQASLVAQMSELFHVGR